VEVVINQLADVIESSVIGIEDEKWGQKVVAAVVILTDSNIKPEEIRTHCKKHLHDWKCPKEVVLVSKLPKNTMGKVLNDKVKRFFK
ncbi:MAG: AMP-binding enzyme, partial [Desulfobulbia bacterium]